MSDPLSIVLTSRVNPPNWMGIAGGSAALWVGADAARTVPTYEVPAQTNLIWAVVLDRQDPTRPAVYQATLPNNTDVPPDLARVLTPGHLLFLVVNTFGTRVPQGALYQTLTANGGGAQLEKLERLATGFPSVVNRGVEYMLVSVPGSGMQGIELATWTNPTRSFTTDEEGRVLPVSDMLLEMIPGPRGYVPVVVG